ncbi:hypothetical protein [Desulfonatronum sp. SC1]|uniref:hypothetical protein n=1 Tax=Desulfonatronum sp. SC1 TaxID=2109626 RepID=UPI000D31AE95|nr:hypothetical protein [Desulfonatronum sp. SC1]PTN37526.1 hypothetical protein C6366_06085 [Desulfonatronum sp. SC1]
MSQLIKRITGTFRFTSACLFPVLLSLGAIIAFILLILFPAFSKNASLEREIQERRNAVERQEMLAPAHALLTSQFRGVANQYVDEDHWTLPAPNTPEMAVPTLEELVDASGLNKMSITPRPSSLSIQDGLSVDMRLSGDFQRLRDLLMSLIAQPWMLNLESLEVIGGGDREEFRIRVNVRLEAEKEAT